MWRVIQIFFLFLKRRAQDFLIYESLDELLLDENYSQIAKEEKNAYTIRYSADKILQCFEDDVLKEVANPHFLRNTSKSGKKNNKKALKKLLEGYHTRFRVRLTDKQKSNMEMDIIFGGRVQIDFDEKEEQFYLQDERSLAPKFLIQKKSPFVKTIAYYYQNFLILNQEMYYLQGTVLIIEFKYNRDLVIQSKVIRQEDFVVELELKNPYKYQEVSSITQRPRSKFKVESKTKIFKSNIKQPLFL